FTDQPFEETTEQLSHGLHFEQESIMAPGALDVQVGYVHPGNSERSHQFLAVVRGIEPIAGKADDQKLNVGRIGKGCGQRTCRGVEVEVIHRLGNVEVAVGVKAAREVTAVVLQVTLHLEFSSELVAVPFSPLETTAKFGVHRRLAQIGNVTEH